jgi:hypothetical protein
MTYPPFKQKKPDHSNVNLERPVRHLNQVELSRRWSISPRTLERWRWLQQEPPYLKIGGRVVYRLDDIEAYEAAQAKNAVAKRVAS